VTRSVDSRVAPPPPPRRCGDGPSDRAPAFDYDAATCRDLSRATSLEWLETNGLGGYACGTISGVRTRRYHGLLMSATAPPADRKLLLSAYDVSLVVHGRRFDLASHRYGETTVHPEGYRLLESFRADPFPTRTWASDGWRLSEEIFLPRHRDAVVVRWRLRAPEGVAGPPPRATLIVRPLVAARDDHATTRRNDALDARLRRTLGGVDFKPYAALPTLRFVVGEADVAGPGVWYENFRYDEEAARGFDAVEDLFSPCAFVFDLGASGEAACVAGTERLSLSDVPRLMEEERSRRVALAKNAPSNEPCVRALAVAADRFVVRRGDGTTILAGYPWFVDWGRDAAIALSGLLLATRRFDEARDVLKTFAAHLDGGVVPNRFPDRGAVPEYNTVDAALWFVEAARAYVAATNDEEFLRATLLPAAREIV
jgi:predicted glycogen debranching enzyme